MRLRELRQEEGLTTYQMAARLEINQGHYCHLENGKRKLTDSIASKIKAEFGISKKQVEDDFVMNNPYLSVMNNWVWKLKINDAPVVQSFINDIGYLKIKDMSEHSEVVEAFIRYIQFTIGNSLEKEFAKDPKMIEYLVSRLQR